MDRAELDHVRQPLGNYWWVTRPKRKLDQMPEVLATIAQEALGKERTGQRQRHLIPNPDPDATSDLVNAPVCWM